MRRLPPILALVALACGTLAVPLAAIAQQDEPQEHRFVPSPEDRAAFQDARIAALHAGLTLTPDQEKLWPPVEQALRDFGKLVADQRQKFRDEKQSLDPVARLQMRSDNMIARGQALKKLADAEAPLYAALTDAQKHRVPVLVRAIFHPFRARFAMMERWRHGPMRDDHMRGDDDDGAGPGGPDKD